MCHCEGCVLNLVTASWLNWLLFPKEIIIFSPCWFFSSSLSETNLLFVFWDFSLPSKHFLCILLPLSSPHILCKHVACPALTAAYIKFPWQYFVLGYSEYCVTILFLLSMRFLIKGTLLLWCKRNYFNFPSTNSYHNLECHHGQNW